LDELESDELEFDEPEPVTSKDVIDVDSIELTPVLEIEPVELKDEDGRSA
jgi:hypothetical protein